MSEPTFPSSESSENMLVSDEAPVSEYRWLTPLSQQFLDKDYLIPGETVDERVNTIVATAERILNKPGFGARFKANLQKGWYSLSTPIWTNFGNDRGLPISCVTGDTWINTRVDGGKQARDIRIGDEVLTHRGRYRRVTNVMVTPKRDNIYRLKVSTRMTNLYITENHLVLTNLGWVRVDELDPDRHLIAVNREVEHEGRPHVCDLREFADYEVVERDGRIWKAGSEAVRPDRRVDVVSYYSAPFRHVPVSDELAWAIGLWFAEGSITRNERGTPNGIRITVGMDEVSEGQRWLSVMSAAFGVNGNGYESNVERGEKTDRWYTVNLNSGVVGKLFATFGDDCKSKTIPEWLMGLPRETLGEFLKGFVFGDGSEKPHDANRVTLANPRLALQVYQIGLIVGKDMSLQMQEKAGRLATTSHVYSVLFRSNTLGTAKASGKSCVPFSDGLSYAPIRTLELTDRVEDVYDFTVEEDHSFSAAGVVVHNCFGSHMSDDTASILRAHCEIGMMTKHGGGTSAYFGELRHRGSLIRKNGESSGSVHFMQMFDQCMNIISQGKTRRGNFAAYLPIDHKDIMEFLTIRCEGSPIQDMSYGVTVPDYWMEEMIGGDKEKRKVWARVLEQRANFGYPYIMFTDNCNRGTVDVYKRNGMKIRHSNLCCVTGDQRVMTAKGAFTARELYEDGSNLTVTDGFRAVSASPMRLVSPDAAVFRVTLKNGMTHTVTACHKVQTDQGMVTASELRVGDKVAIQTHKGVFGKKHAPEKALLLGLYQGDGTQTEDAIFIDVWENDFDLVSEVEAAVGEVYKEEGWEGYAVDVPGRGTAMRSATVPSFCRQHPSQNGVSKLRLQSTRLKQDGFAKGRVPQWIWESDEETQWQYVRGLFIADGTATVGKRKHGSPLHLALVSVDKSFLADLQILLANLGVPMSLCLARPAGESVLPDGKGGKRAYVTQSLYRLVCGSRKTAKLFDFGTGFLSRKGIDLTSDGYSVKSYSPVVSVEPAGREAVYCCEVYTDDHRWVCNGVQTHNSEIMLPDNEEESFVCDLSSMNILYYDEWKDTDAVELMTYFLDAVMTEFIEKAKKIPYMDRPVRFAERHRALGIGWLGWHSALQAKMIPFESLEAKMLNAEVARTIHAQAYAASEKMAKEYGEPEVLKGYGRRNTTLLAIAPTKSSAFILGQVSEGIEPNRTNYYIKDLAKGKFTIRNPYLVKLLAEKGKDDDETWDSILKAGGSVQHLSFLSDHEKGVFKTFAEISPKEIIIQAATRQKWIDQSQSLNLMIHPSVPVRDVNALMIEAWQMGVKSLYYQMSVNAAQSFARSILTCTSCEA